jgi:endonuclease/exonuclease/phosphatase family metal-dependent hydrolase
MIAWAIAMRGAEFNWVTTLLLYMPQHIWLIVPTILLLIAWARRNRPAILGNLVTIGFVSVAVMGFRFPLWRAGEVPGISLRVMTYNMNHGRAGLGRVAETIRKQAPDIVCLQEANPGPWYSELPKQMDSLMPGWHAARFRAFATLSRYPIVSREVHEMQPETGRVVLETVVNVKGRRLVVLNTHLSTASEGTLLHRSVSLVQYMRDCVATRSFQVAVLQKVVGASKGAVVVMGDFNNPPRGMLYHRLLTQLRDAFGLAGFGFGQTYSSRLPVLRVDYVFVNDELGVKRCFVPRASSSDHRPVVADLVIMDTGE